MSLACGIQALGPISNRKKRRGTGGKEGEKEGVKKLNSVAKIQK
jgi:hypothetical protein